MSNIGKLGSKYWRLWWASAISNLGDGITSVAYPWLASAVTRSPLLIAIVGFASRLPWLVFTLFAGVISDRFDRRKIILRMDLVRGFLTVIVAIVVMWKQDSLPKLNDLAGGLTVDTNYFLYFVLVTTALLFGLAEVLRDNTAQTILPSIVHKENLEKANGRLWSAESLTNTFIGPPLGSLIIGIAIFLPFWFDAASFFISVALIASIAGSFKAVSDAPATKINFKADIKEGFAWLWNHKFFRNLAIILGLLNFTGTLVGATYILFAQEVLKVDVKIFAILGIAGAVGGLIGSSFGDKISKRLGSGPTLRFALIAGPVGAIIIGLTNSWIVVFIVTAFESLSAVLWNLITVSLRQSVIPSHLIGRVNSVYRFFGWGTIPLGMILGGAIVSLLQNFMIREYALRAPYLISALIGTVLFIFAAPFLTTARIDAVKGEAENK
jgi:MFS family permease